MANNCEKRELIYRNVSGFPVHVFFDYFQGRFVGVGRMSDNITLITNKGEVYKMVDEVILDDVSLHVTDFHAEVIKDPEGKESETSVLTSR